MQNAKLKHTYIYICVCIIYYFYVSIYIFNNSKQSLLAIFKNMANFSMCPACQQSIKILLSIHFVLSSNWCLFE